MANLHFILDESKRGMAVDLADCLATLTTNNITQMIMNKDIYARRSRSKSGILADCTPIQVAFHEIFTLLGTANIADFLPFLKPFDPQGLNKQLKDVHRRTGEVLDAIIEEHRQRQLNGPPENYRHDFLDALLGFVKTADLQEPLSMENIKGLLLVSHLVKESFVYFPLRFFEHISACESISFYCVFRQDFSVPSLVDMCKLMIMLFTPS